MSHLSQAEVTAGISRRAIESFHRKNGRATLTSKVDLSASKTLKVGDDTPGQPPQRIPVVETWCSSLDLLNLNGFSFAIRYTQHISDRADVTTLYLNRIDLEALVRKCKDLLAESGQAIVEFAVLLPIFVLVGFGIVDVQWMTRDAQAIEYIVTEAARCEAIKAPACPNETQTANFALQLAQNVHLPISKEQIATPACNAATCSVSINFPFQALGPWFPRVTIQRTGQAAVP
jgi:TadE-like protein